jgi:hypothetical protein
MPMPQEKRKRIAPAILFLFGVMASLKAVADTKNFWPPEVLWASLSPPHRFQFCGGIAVIAVAIGISIGLLRPSQA